MAPLRVPYKTVHGVDIPADIHVPEKTQRGLAPVILMMHGGGFVIGSSAMMNPDQIADCNERGWIVLNLEYRLSPGVDALEGGMADTKDAYEWVQTGGLARVLQEAGSSVKPDPDRIMAMGLSAGGLLALSLAWTTQKRPIAILDFYGAKHLDQPFWNAPVPAMQASLPPKPPASFFEHLYTEKATFQGGMSLEGHKEKDEADKPPKPKGPDLSDPRPALLFHSMADGSGLKLWWPKAPQDLHLIDPFLNVHDKWPPTVIIHGTADVMVPLQFSRDLEAALKEAGVENEFIEVEGEPHTFAGSMTKGSKTWDVQRKGFDWIEKVLEKSY